MKENELIYNWAKHPIGESKAVKHSANQHVDVDDETLRDGLQGTQVESHPTTEGKKIYLDWVSRFVEHADIGFPGSEEEHQKEIEELIKYAVTRRLDITLSCAARGAALEDVKPIIDISHNLDGYLLEADIFLDGSTYRSLKEGWDRKEKLDKLSENIKLLKQHKLPVMFVAERATSTSPEELFEICQLAADLGVERICLADTQGCADPQAITNIFRWGFSELGKKYREIIWDFHGHNDLNLGVANCLTAVQEGVNRIHATKFCIGERAGNVDLATILLILNLHGFRNIDLQRLQEFSRVASDVLHIAIPKNAPVIGESAFATSSGVHSAPLDKSEDEVSDIYFPYHPGLVGRKPKVEVGRFSGAATVRYKLKSLGIQPIDGMVDEILHEAKNERGFISETTIRNIAQRYLNNQHQEK